MITFHNITITLDLDDARDAYDALCELLASYPPGASRIDWCSDSYSINNGEEHDTEELWPEMTSEVAEC